MGEMDPRKGSGLGKMDVGRGEKERDSRRIVGKEEGR
jgi:hypothetical protein